MPRLVVYSDYACPFCYLATPALARLRQEGVEVELRAFELRPDPVPLRDARAPEVVAEWQGTILPLARELALEALLPPLLPRTRKAHEAAAFARERGRFQELHEALFRALFAEGRDIGRIDVLVALGKGVGLDATELALALGLDGYASQVAAEAAEAARAGVEALPAFRVGGELALGLMPYEQLRDWVRAAARHNAEQGRE